MESRNRYQAAADSGKQNRRRKYFVNPAFQWKYTLTIAITVFVATSAASSVLYTVLHQQARMRVMQPNSYTTDVASVVLLSALAFSAVTAGALGLWCVIATHRICGPVFVLQRYMSELAEGHLPNLRPLRKKDEFKELYATCSRAVESLKATKQAELILIGQARDAVRQGVAGDDEARKDAFDSIATNLDILYRGAETALNCGTESPPERKTQVARTSEPVPVGVG